MAQDSLVKGLEKQRIELEMKQSELLDMSPDNRYDLKVGKNFKADAWTQDNFNTIEMGMGTISTGGKELWWFHAMAMIAFIPSEAAGDISGPL